MPQRFLRPGIRTSQRWNAVSRDAQALYIAILTLVDDYGRYDGRDSILCADAFTIWNELHPNEAITPQRIPALRSEMMRNGLVDFYEVEGKKCLQVIQWQERVRENAKEKWPKNPNPLRNPAESCGILPPSSPTAPSPAPAPDGNAPAEIPTWKEVKEYADGHAVSEKSARAFFDHHQGNNLWQNGYGRAINWRHKLVSWQVKDREKSQLPAHSTIQSGHIPRHTGGNF